MCQRKYSVPPLRIALIPVFCCRCESSTAYSPLCKLRVDKPLGSVILPVIDAIFADYKDESATWSVLDPTDKGDSVDLRSVNELKHTGGSME